MALRDMLAGHFWLSLREFTLEANPGTADAATVRAWKGAGVTRISVGVQSFDDRTLKTIGRGYSARTAVSFCEDVLAAGFASVGFDLMIGIPGETRASAAATLQETLRLKPDHVSLYILENVEGLPFESVVARQPADEDIVVENYAMFQAALESAGLPQYEISNFARPGHECRHNLKYWRYEPFLGLGPSACSHLGARRWCNKRTIGEWAAALKGGRALEEEMIDLTPDVRAKEALVFGLRLLEGLDLVRFRDRYGVDLDVTFPDEIRELTQDGFLGRENGRLFIPAQKLLLSNHVFARFA